MQRRPALLCPAGLPNRSALLPIVAHPHLLRPPHHPNLPPSRSQPQLRPVSPCLRMSQSPHWYQHLIVVDRQPAKHIRSGWRMTPRMFLPWASFGGTMIVCWRRTCAASLVGGGGVGRVALVGAVLVSGVVGEDGDEEAPMQATTAIQMAKFRLLRQRTCRP